MDDSIPTGPLSVRTNVRIAAAGVEEEKLRDIVEWADVHSPVADALRRAVPSRIEVKIE